MLSTIALLRRDASKHKQFDLEMLNVNLELWSEIRSNNLIYLMNQVGHMAYQPMHHDWANTFITRIRF